MRVVVVRSARFFRGIDSRGGAAGFRGAALGGGFRGPAFGGGFRGARFAGFRGPVIGRGVRVAHFRRRGFPIAAGGWGYYDWGYPYDSCIVWTGYNWINICY